MKVLLDASLAQSWIDDMIGHGIQAIRLRAEENNKLLAAEIEQARQLMIALNHCRHDVPAQGIITEELHAALERIEKDIRMLQKQVAAVLLNAHSNPFAYKKQDTIPSPCSSLGVNEGRERRKHIVTHKSGVVLDFFMKEDGDLSFHNPFPKKERR